MMRNECYRARTLPQRQDRLKIVTKEDLQKKLDFELIELLTKKYIKVGVSWVSIL